MTITLSLLLATPALAAVGTITVDTGDGPVGTTVTVIGSGFTPNTAYAVKFGATVVNAGAISPSGSLSTYFNVPSFPRGQYSITVTTNAPDTSNTENFTLRPDIALGLTSGRVGDQFTVTGTGFRASSTVTVLFDTATVATVLTDANGSFANSVITVPTTTRGNHVVTARDTAGASPGSVFNVLEPQIILSPNSGRVGDKFTVSGTGFKASASVSIFFDSASVGSVVTDANGSFSNATVTVPPSAGDNHVVTARDTVAISPGVAFITQQSLVVSPTSGVVGDKLTINGSGFARSSNVTFTLDGQVANFTALVADANGSFSGSISIPPCGSGPHQLQARDVQGKSASVIITVGHKVAITPTAVATGEQLTVSGSGFASNSNLTLSIDGQNINTGVTTAANGSFTNSVSIPLFPGGQHELQVRDGLGNTATAAFTVGQKMSIEPATGLGGTMVTISGSGFTAGKQVTIRCNGSPVATNPATIYADNKGCFTGTFQAPAGIIGSYSVNAEDGASSASTTFLATFRAEISPMTSAASPGYAGMPLTINGFGFKSNAEIAIKDTSIADSPVLAIATSDAAGVFSASFNAPSTKGGIHTITAGDGVNSKQFTFVMESVTPTAPALILPEILAKVSQPVSFDWTKAVDPSGITYTLQIATDREFRSVVFEKKGITSPGYTMLKKEKLRPASKENPYFWRVKAVDGTATESPWSDAMAFYVGLVITITDEGVLSFDGLATLPLNVVYAAIGGIIFLIALFSFWLGRKTGREY